MAGRMEGKVALITGAARGQGRSHAVRLAEEGADIIASTSAPGRDRPYEMATPDDLAETSKLVEDLDRRIVAREADVRDRAAAARSSTRASPSSARSTSCAPTPASSGSPAPGDGGRWEEMIDINLTGVWKTIKAAVPAMIDAGRAGRSSSPARSPGSGFPNIAHYTRPSTAWSASCGRWPRSWRRT